MTDLSTLLSRVEGGSGADRELDAEIAAAFYQPKDWRPSCRTANRRGYITIAYVDRDGRRTSGTQLAPAYTTDLNAVIALVEARLPGWIIQNLSEWEDDRLREMGAWMAQIRERGRPPAIPNPAVCMHAPTPARALLAALIRAEMEKVK